MIDDLLHYWSTGGLVMPVLAVICYGIWFTFLKLRGAMLRLARAPAGFEEDLRNRLANYPPEAKVAYAAAISKGLTP